MLLRHHPQALSPAEKRFSIVFDMCPLVYEIITKDTTLSFELTMRTLDLTFVDIIHLTRGGDDNDGG
ncbi:hypothetical protein Fmac_002927 [Flemingia macrophylla]|uniref:Uncharacterized protein n=1 Tax=Flemingia macrophylla TaxID=520843 RepID=A0ABD1NLB3_9FABA